MPTTKIVPCGPGLDHWAMAASVVWPRSAWFCVSESMATLGHNLAIAGALAQSYRDGWDACDRSFP